MTPELREYFSVPQDQGVLVTHVEPGGPANKAGLKAGDVILRAGERSIRGPADLVLEAARAPAGQNLSLRVVRDKGEQEVGLLPQGEASPWLDPEYWRDWLDKGVRDGSRELRERLDDLQRRLDELERRFDEERRGHDMDRT
jgi:membrane-associated protease RseP (regulator of RpoE activity)